MYIKFTLNIKLNILYGLNLFLLNDYCFYLLIMFPSLIE